MSTAIVRREDFIPSRVVHHAEKTNVDHFMGCQSYMLHRVSLNRGITEQAIQDHVRDQCTIRMHGLWELFY